jgi:hypothetical protein
MFNRKIISSLGLIVSMAAIFTGCGKTTASVETVTEAETKAVVKEEVTTQAPTEAPTEAETEAVTEAETETEPETEAASVEAYEGEPVQETVQEVVIEVTEAATEAPTEAATQASTSSSGAEIRSEEVYYPATGEVVVRTYEVVQFTDEKVDEILRANNSKLVGTAYTYEILSTGGCRVYDVNGIYRVNIKADGSYVEKNKNK